MLLDFPIPSEQFVLREVEALQRSGISLRVLALTPRPVSADAAFVLRKPRWISPSLWMGAARQVVDDPASLWRSVRSLRGLADGRLPMLRSLHWLVASLYLTRVLRGSRPALLHAHFASAPATVARLAAAALEVPWGLSIHAHDLYAERQSIDRLLESASHALACSSTSREDLCARLPAALRSRVVQLHHGLDLTVWTSRLPLPSSPVPCILAIGRLVPKKGFDVLVEACQWIRAAGVSFRCEIIGAGKLDHALGSAIRRLGLEGHVRMLPWQDTATLRQKMRTASILVVPSVIGPDGDRDNIPNVVIEALALGLPVVASDIASLRALLGPTAAGLLVPSGASEPLAHAIQRIFSEPELREALRSSGRTLVERHFDMQKTSEVLVRRLATSASTAELPS